MMNPVEEILQVSRQPIRSFAQVTIGQVFSRMQRSMFLNVIDARE